MLFDVENIKNIFLNIEAMFAVFRVFKKRRRSKLGNKRGDRIVSLYTRYLETPSVLE